MSSATWTAPAVERPEGDNAGDERATLTGYLAFHRATFLHKCAGLDGEQLARRSVEPSSLSLLGLVRHLAKVERIWFAIRLDGQDLPRLHAERDSDVDGTDPDTAEQDYAQLVEEQARADAVIATASLDDTFEHEGERLSLRVLLQHVMHEYARHNGHADLLRERIDGVTGV